ncbi:hypothetical protein Dimus_038409 [Dionaea muscipula]
MPKSASAERGEGLWQGITERVTRGSHPRVFPERASRASFPREEGGDPRKEPEQVAREGFPSKSTEQGSELAKGGRRKLKGRSGQRITYLELWAETPIYRGWR